MLKHKIIYNLERFEKIIPFLVGDETAWVGITIDSVVNQITTAAMKNNIGS